MSPTYGHMTKLFSECESEHKGNKQTRKRKFSAKFCGFFRQEQIQKIKLLEYYTEKDKKKKKKKKKKEKNCHH